MDVELVVDNTRMRATSICRRLRPVAASDGLAGRTQPLWRTWRTWCSLRLVLASEIMLRGSEGLAANVPIVGDVDVVEIAPMRFGSMIVLSNGRRTVTPSAGIVDDGGISPAGSGPSPAQYMVSYDRDNSGRQQLDVEFLVTVPSAPHRCRWHVSSTRLPHH